jgi:hypothetical protein
MQDDDEFLRLSSTCRGSLRRLDRGGSLAQLDEPVRAQLAASAGVVVLAFDFDQTLKLKDRLTGSSGVRGGDESVAWLRAIVAEHADALQLCVITAADVSIAGVRTIASELALIGLADLFDVDALPSAERDAIVAALLAQTATTRAELRRRLVAVSVLKTTRFACDLERVARESVVCGDAAVQFRLVRDGQRGALLTERDAAVVQCWRAYHEHADDVDDASVWQYFGADWDAAADLRVALAPFGVAERHVERMLRETASVCDADGVKIARFGRVLCSKYNKPEALQLFMQQERLTADAVFFVDDNLTNAFNMFASQLGATAAAAAVHSMWYEPPAGGKEESVRDERSVALAHKVIEDFRKRL